MTHVGDANLLRQAKQNGFADTKLAPALENDRRNTSIS